MKPTFTNVLHASVPVGELMNDVLEERDDSPLHSQGVDNRGDIDWRKLRSIVMIENDQI